MLDEVAASFGVFFAKKSRHDVEAVQQRVLRDADTEVSSEAGAEVNGADDFLRDPRFDRSWPVGDEGCAGAAFLDLVLAAGIRPSRFVVMEFFHGGVFVTIIEDGTVVRAEDDHGVFLQSLFLEDSDNFANTPVQLDDGIASEAGAGFAVKTLMRHAWHVNIVRGKVEEKGIGFVLFDPSLRFLHPLVSKVLIAETGGVASGVEANAADAIVDGAVVAVAPVHLELITVADACFVVRAGFFVAYPERVLGVEVEHAVVLHIDLGDTVIGGGQQEGIIKTNLEWARLEVAVPVRFVCSQSKVPLADDRCFVARLLQQVRHGDDFRLDQGGRVGACNSGAFDTKGVGASKKRVAGWRAGGGGAVTAGELQTLGSELINVRGLDVFRFGAIATDVSVAEVVRHDDDDIWFYRACPPLEGFAFRPSAAGACAFIARPLLGSRALALRALGRSIRCHRMVNGE